MEFDYLIDKIRDAEFNSDPFEHLYIKDFFSDDHFNMMIEDRQVHFSEASTNIELRQSLKSNGFEVVNFPGCTTSEDDYFSNLESNSWGDIAENNNHYDKHLAEELEGYGVTYKLGKIADSKLSSLIAFMNSRRFHQALREKFDISGPTSITMQFQKNLSKYEISPHPDIRQKALTMLINANVDRGDDITGDNFNTHILSLKDDRWYVKDFWKNNQDIQRCWIPWSWCETKKVCGDNNSFLVFKPSNDTLHAVRLSYNHLKQQRTQVYGNLMYMTNKTFLNRSYKDIQ